MALSIDRGHWAHTMARPPAAAANPGTLLAGRGGAVPADRLDSESALSRLGAGTVCLYASESFRVEASSDLVSLKYGTELEQWRIRRIRLLIELRKHSAVLLFVKPCTSALFRSKLPGDAQGRSRPAAKIVSEPSMLNVALDGLRLEA